MPVAAAPGPSVVRAQVEGTKPVETKRHNGVDPAGRLIAAPDRVAGFEVPIRARLKRTHRHYLELALQASPEMIAEFYSGVDRETGRRFTDRQYLVEEMPVTGDINVRHTAETLERLALEDQYKTAHIAIRKRTHWHWEVRIYESHSDKQRREFVPDLGTAGAAATDLDHLGAPGKRSATALVKHAENGTQGHIGDVSGPGTTSPRATQNGDAVPASEGATTGPRREEAEGGSDRQLGAVAGAATGTRGATDSSGASSDTPPKESAAADFTGAWDGASERASTAVINGENPPSTVGGIQKQPQQMTIHEHPPGRYGPYPSSGRKNIRERVRRWQAANPNQPFLD